jgi:hypothetical protein
MWLSVGNVDRGEMANSWITLLSMTDRQLQHCRLLILRSVNVHTEDLCTVTPCSLVLGNRRFREICCWKWVLPVLFAGSDPHRPSHLLRARADELRHCLAAALSAPVSNPSALGARGEVLKKIYINSFCV